MVSISIIVPAYNEEKYIEATLISVKNQNFEDYEIIVSDCYSSDNTVKIAEKYANKIVFSRIRSTAAARNIGAEHATGKYLIFLDSDTTLSEGYLKRIYDIFRQDKYVAFCGSFRFSDIRAAYQVTGHVVNFYFLMLDLLGKTAIPGFNFCISRSAFQKIGGFENVFMEDANLSSKLNKLGKTKYFTHFFAITSSRRLEKMGVFGTLDYYCNISGKWNGVVEFSKRYIKVN